MKTLLFLIVVASFGCSTVYTLTPVTDKTEMKVQEELRGVWKNGDEIFYAQFDANGAGKIAEVKWANEEFVLESLNFLATANVISIQAAQEVEEGYLLGTFKVLDSGELIIWPPKVEKFEELVTTQKIGGTIKKEQYSTTVTVTNGSELIKLIEPLEDFFDWTDPVVFQRVSEKVNEE